MKLVTTLSACIALSSISLAQVQVGELLAADANSVRHYRTDGTLVQTFDPVAKIVSAAILPDDTWVLLRREPYGLIIFDPATATTVLDVDFAPGDFFDPDLTDVGVRMDGTILVADVASPLDSGSVARFDRNGDLIDQWFLSSNAGGGGNPHLLDTDDADGMWVALTEPCCTWLQYRDSEGNLVSEEETIWPTSSVAVAPGGTNWTVEDDGWVWSRPFEGGGQHNPYGSNPASIAPVQDGTLWYGSEVVSDLRQFTKNGVFQTSFPIVGNAEFLRSPTRTVVGANYCAANPNSTGAPGEIVAFGSAAVADADLHLLAQGLPTGRNGYFLNAPAAGFVPNPGGSAGNLCLGGGVGRHRTLVQSSGAAGAIHIQADGGALPRPGGATYALQPGDTWYFQLWHRDGGTSNFTDGTAVTFL